MWMKADASIVDAPLEQDADDRRIADELAQHRQREVVRRRRASVIRDVKADVQKRGLPSVSDKTVYEMGREGEIRAIVEPADEDGMTAIALDTTGNGEVDTVLHFNKRKKLRDIEDLLSEDAQIERKQVEREQAERKRNADAISLDIEEHLSGKKRERAPSLVDNLFGNGDSGDAEDETRRAAEEDAARYSLSAPENRQERKGSPLTRGKRPNTYARRPRPRRRRSNRFHAAITR